MADTSGTYGAGTAAIMRVVSAPLLSPPTHEEPTMLIRITERCRVSLDGTHVLPLDKGTTTDVSIEIGESLIEQGKAEAIEPEPAPAPPTVPPAPVDNTTAGAAAAGEQVPGSTLPAAPASNASRAECDAVAKELGLDPAAYANRDEVREAIVARLDYLATTTA